MGLLTNSGSPILWTDARRPEANAYVLKHGILQFLEIYRHHVNTTGKPFLWGDELEYLLIKRGDKKVTISLRGDKVLEECQALEEQDQVAHWHPEFGSFMVESTPINPYDASIASLRSVEGNMQRRYEYLLSKTLPHGELPMLLTTFPRLGVGMFTTPAFDPKMLPTHNPISKSLFIPDACINGHPRFATLSQNIRLRRNRKVCIQIPILLDERTVVDPILNIDAHPFNRFIVGDLETPTLEGKKRERDESTSSGLTVAPSFTQFYYAQYYGNKDAVQTRYESSPAPGKTPSQMFSHPSVYMDCMAFGMGCCCLQVTMQLSDVEEARHIYDQLAVLCPVMLALTAGTAIQKGMLTDNDVRWMTISESVDDRTVDEVPRIQKSRYDSISTFMGQRSGCLATYNDCIIQVEEESLTYLRDQGIDKDLARHVAHLFIRDPLVIYDGKLKQLDDAQNTDHFENIQSTNWQTVRFKPPPAGQTDIGWRVEFRVMEVSITSFENAAFSVFTLLFSRAILKYNLCLYVPLSKVDVNLAQAHRRDAVLERRFYWRVNVEGCAEGTCIKAVCEDLLIDEIVNGTKSGSFKGIAHYVLRLLAEMEAASPAMDVAAAKDVKRLHQYVDLVRRKATGKVKTTAAYFRQMVKRHPLYQRDSVVSDEIAHDIVNLAFDMSCGRNIPEDLIPPDLFISA